VSDKRLFILAHAKARQGAKDCIDQLPEGWRVECSPPRRGADINAALHAMLGEIAAAVPWAGKRRSIEVWKRLLVAAWTRAVGEQVEFLPALDGHGVDIVFRRTSAMTQAEMRDLLAFVEAWAAENVPERETA
jgi:hypothetical protein